MFFFGDIVHLCYFAKKKQSISMPYWYIPMVFSPLFFNQKTWGHVGPQKTTERSPTCLLWGGQPEVLGLHQSLWRLEPKTEGHGFTGECHRFFFSTKGRCFFLAGKSRWMKSIEPFERFKIQDFEYLHIYTYVYYIYIRIWLICNNFTLSRFLRPAMLTYFHGRSNY